MKFKIFFFLFLIFLLFYIGIDYLNPGNVKLYVGFGKFYEASMATYVVISFILGIIVSIIISFFSDLKRLVVGWKQDKKERKNEELKELFEKARAYDLRGDRDKAIDSLNRIIRRNPDMKDSYFYLTDIYSSMRDYEKALETLRLAEHNLGKRESILMRKVRVRLASKDTNKMEDELLDVLKLNELNLDAMMILRDYYISKGEWGEALDIQKKIRKFIKTEEENRKYLGIRCEKVRALFKKRFEQNADRIVKELKEIIGEDKRFVPAYVILGEVYRRMDKLNEAGRIYGRGYSKTGHVIFLSKLEDLYIERGDPGVILKIYRRLIDVSPKNYLILFLYARLCLRLEMIDEAMYALNIIFADGVDFKGLRKAMADTYIHRGETEKAVVEYRKAFPAEHIYLPFKCSNCQAKKDEWVDFCDSCYSWNTINARMEDFLQAGTAELKVVYEGEDWQGEAQL